MREYNNNTKSYIEDNITGIPFDDFKKGIIKALPIIIGYLPIAISFGIIAAQANIEIYQAVLMSLLVYAGASQFMAVNMILIGALGIEIVFATLILNFRHFIMSMSLMNRLEGIPLPWKSLLSFGITDETFAVAAIDESIEKASPYFILGLFIGAYGSWSLGTLLGGLLAMVIPPTISKSMSIALYAMFIALLVPAIRRQWRLGIIAVVSSLLNLVLSKWLSGGWGIVLSTMLGSSVGIFLMKEE